MALRFRHKGTKMQTTVGNSRTLLPLSVSRIEIRRYFVSINVKSLYCFSTKKQMLEITNAISHKIINL